MRGGKRPGAGRPKKADEEKMLELMKGELTDDKYWKLVAAKVKGGDIKAMTLWAGYRWGKPNVKVDHTTDGDKIDHITFEVIKPKD